MEQLTNPDTWQEAVATLRDWVAAEVLVYANLIQLLVIAALLSAALLAAPLVRNFLERQDERGGWGRVPPSFIRSAALVSTVAVWLLLQWLAYFLAGYTDQPRDLLKITVSLLTAWIVIRMTSGLVRDAMLSKTIAVIAWTVAALSILGLLGETIAFLDGIAITIGELRISALLVIKGVISLGVLLWASLVASRIFERRVTQSDRMTPSLRVLTIKLFKVVLVSIAIIVALTSIGIDLTALAVVGGAIGVGIGFGLQKIVSNLISGVIILLDRSIKPGDVITLGDTFGWVQSLGARYTSVITRDGTEWLIPNEDMITQQVVNWSYSNDKVRLKIPIGISYRSDPRKAVALCYEAAAEEDRILTDPPVNVLVKGFGDSSVDLEMRIWIRDPQNGVSNVKSAVLLRVWDKFHESGIQIPFPQRDLHLKPPADINVWMKGPADGRGAAVADGDPQTDVAA